MNSDGGFACIVVLSMLMVDDVGVTVLEQQKYSKSAGVISGTPDVAKFAVGLFRGTNFSGFHPLGASRCLFKR